MRSVRRLHVVLGSIVVVASVGALGGVLGNERMVHVSLVFLAAVAAAGAVFASARSGRAVWGVSDVRRRLREQSAVVENLATGVRSSRRTLRRMGRDVGENLRRVVVGTETIRTLGEDRHQETLAQLEALRKSVVAEARATEAVVQLVPRIRPSALLPASGGWAMDARSLAHLVDIVEASRPRFALELGSGSSTVYLGYLARRSGGRVVSVDHDETFAARTRAEVERHGLAEVVEVRVAPLREQSIGGDTGLWYELDAFSDVQEIDLLLVDGPPKRTEPRARRHALPALVDRLAPGAVVVLDDADRPDEKEIVRQWAADHDVFTVVEHAVSRLAVLVRN